MLKKAKTKDCENRHGACPCYQKNELCTWGHSTDWKVLHPPAGKMKGCTLEGSGVPAPDSTSPNLISWIKKLIGR